MKEDITVLPTNNDLIRRAADRIATCLNEALEVRGTAFFVLSGGSTPVRAYEMLASDQYAVRVDWSRVHLLWGDERCVPPDAPESNFSAANEILIKKLPIPAYNTHRIPAELPPDKAAHEYEREIVALFKLNRGELPRFDLVLLGLGEDGHTASLFTNSPALRETRRLVIDTYAGKRMSHRITMTIPVINNAAGILFLVSGQKKSEILRHVLHGERTGYPAQMVKPVSGWLHWFVDSDAASLLKRTAQ